MTTADYGLDDLLGELDRENPEEELGPEDQFDPSSQRFVDRLVAQTMVFMEELVGFRLFPYQREPAARIIESLVINDGEEITLLAARQSGKTETIADVIATLMILLPKLARIEPFDQTLEKFKDGLWVGCFAPVEGQAETLFNRIVTRLTSDRALEIMLDPEIDDAPEGGGKLVRLKKSGSFVRMQTANPRARIESKSYHLILIDEAQGADEKVVRRSIHPMGAFYNATLIKTGTPSTFKGDFHKAIQHNKRRATRRGARKNHYQADWKECAKHNENYAKYVRKEILRLGEDSDEFQMSYNCKWLLERGMFTTSAILDGLGDLSMEIVKEWWRSPVLVGIDPARTVDSTVVTVVWVDWESPDEFGYYDHRILNWLEIHGDRWEEQYYQIVDFLSHYDVLGVGVDAQGMGDAVADRLARLLPRSEVSALESTLPAQSKRWKHLSELMSRGMISWPAHAKTRRLKTWRRFRQQMEDLEKHHRGAHLIGEAPEEAEAHDDYCDSLALACVLTKDLTLPEVEETVSPFTQRRR
jgi:hypothetical protein